MKLSHKVTDDGMVMVTLTRYDGVQRFVAMHSDEFGTRGLHAANGLLSFLETAMEQLRNESGGTTVRPA